MKKNESKLIIRVLSKSFNTPDNNIQVLTNINLHVEKGELVALIGPSGCGKTVFLDCISGLLTHDTGEILVGDNAINKGKHFVSYLLQNDGLLPWRRIIDNVMLPLEIKGVDKKNAKKRAQKLLKQFGLSEFEKYYPSQLSGGMIQRAALARTYLVDNDIILMDEPFSRLDALTKLTTQQWFLYIWEKYKKTVLFVTHDIDEAIFLADRIYVMSVRPGRIIPEYTVTKPRPRKNDVSTTSQFISLKKKLLEALKKNRGFNSD